MILDESETLLARETRAHYIIIHTHINISCLIPKKTQKRGYNEKNDKMTKKGLKNMNI